MKTCLCHSKKLFRSCCKPFLSGEQKPLTPQELMQSRFSAYVDKNEAYLLQTWAPETRPTTIDMSQSPQWLGLQIIRSSSCGGQGLVEFKATYMDQNGLAVLHETSRFTRNDKQWFYVDGDLHRQQIGKTARNSPCPCGSGKKFKRCCS